MSPRGFDGPLFSIVTPVYDPPVDVLSATIASVTSQSCQDWELILIDDCSPNPEVRKVLRSAAAKDSRIRVIERRENGHIVAASNDGVEAARGQFIALLDHDDLLTPDALSTNAKEIAKFDDVDYLYSDEDKVDETGKIFTAKFEKPDWSPERLRAQHYCSHLSVLRASLVRDVGGFRQGFDGSQDHDLVLRVTERARRIVHIRAVLYHWRIVPGSAAGAEGAGAKPYALEAGRRAVQDQLDRLQITGTVELGVHGTYAVKRPLPAERRVSIIIPTRGSSMLAWGRKRVMVVEAVRSALARTSHKNLEVVVVYDEPTPPEVLTALREIAGHKLVLVPFHEEFNYSRKMNLGVLSSTGDRLILLNDDTEARSDGWVEELLAPLEESDVGMTGAKLLFSNMSIQHAGLAFTRRHNCHPYRGVPSGPPGPFNILVVNREVSGVTGACIGMRRETYLELGGLTEALPASFNDVDQSFKVIQAGYRVVMMPRCELFHFETQTREPIAHRWEAQFIEIRWGIHDRDRFTPTFPNMPPTQAEERRLEATRAKLRADMSGDAP